VDGPGVVGGFHGVRSSDDFCVWDVGAVADRVAQWTAGSDGLGAVSVRGGVVVPGGGCQR
jgi:hypothetical protein